MAVTSILQALNIEMVMEMLWFTINNVMYFDERHTRNLINVFHSLCVRTSISRLIENVFEFDVVDSMHICVALALVVALN